MKKFARVKTMSPNESCVKKFDTKLDPFAERTFFRSIIYKYNKNKNYYKFGLLKISITDSRHLNEIFFGNNIFTTLEYLGPCVFEIESTRNNLRAWTDRMSVVCIHIKMYNTCAICIHA